MRRSQTNGDVLRGIGLAFASIVFCLFASQAPAQDEEQDELFYFRPDTPVRLIRGAMLAERLERPALARRYLRELIDAQPSADVLMELRSEFGIGNFLMLSSREALQPASRDLLTLINDASRQEAATAASVSISISQLTQPADARDAALRILSAEDEAVLPLLTADRSTAEGKLAAALLASQARRFRRGLLAALPDADESTRVRILTILGASASRPLATDLIRYRFDESTAVSEAATTATNRLLVGGRQVAQPQTVIEASDLLVRQAQDLVSRAGLPFPTERDRLDEDVILREEDALAEPDIYGSVYLRRAVRLASDAVAIAPDSSVALATLTVCELAEQSWPAQWPEQLPPLPEVTGEVAAPSPAHSAVLSIAFSTGNVAAIMQFLSVPQTSIPVLTHNARLRRQCLLAADPRIRLLTAGLLKAAGISSIYSRDAVVSCVGGSDLTEVVVIDSRSSESASTVAALKGLKFSVAGGMTGYQGFELAARQLRPDMILVHSNCLRWNLSDTIANLRSDYRMRQSPIIIYGPPEHERRTEAIRSSFDGIWFVPEPISDVTFLETIRLDKVTSPLLTQKERAAMIRYARTLR